MSEPFIAEVRIMPYSFAPRDWAYCDGQLLPISQNPTLFSLIGNIYGGDGRTTFALPNLQGRVPIHPSNTIEQGTSAGSSAVTLTEPQLPAHSHSLECNPDRSAGPNPQNGLLGRTRGFLPYSDQEANAHMAPQVIGTAGQSLAHENRQPYLTVSFFIALQGIYPSRN